MYVRVRVWIFRKAKKFALYIAHFANFVLKICINLGKNILICCKTLKIQTFWLNVWWVANIFVLLHRLKEIRHGKIDILKQYTEGVKVVR